MKGRGTRIGAILILVLLICITGIVILGTDIFNIQKISVKGSEDIDKNVIISISGISYGDSIFKISRKQVRERLENTQPYPLVKEILLRLPDEVEIQIEERAATAYIPYLSSYIVIDKNAFIVDIVKQGSGEAKHMKIEGVRLLNFAKGTQLELIESEDIKQRVIISLLDSISAQGVQNVISIIHMSDVDNIQLETKDGIIVKLGQATQVDTKLSWILSDAYTDLVDENMQGVLDVSVAEKAVFRPKQELNEVGE
ncbi:MAG TPA: FtsQ-type POTRA domain-containing protein [Bacillota bacterium]|nr:FtsQ-type POTRA domain-containing protein [Bacillota bacterium]